MTTQAAPAPATAPAAPKPAPANGAAKGAPQSPVRPGMPAAPAQAEGAAPVEQKFKVKVDGEIREFTLAEMERYASKGKFADKATQEAKEAIKRAKAAEAKLLADAEAAKTRAKSDTDAWLKEHGIDPEEYARAKLEKKVAEGQMSPEQKRAAELEAENKRLLSEKAKLDEERQQEQARALQTHLQRRIETELAAAAKRANLTPDGELFYAVYESFKEAFDLGLLPVDANGLLPHHADRIVEDAMAKLDGAKKNIHENVMKLSGQALEDFIGKESIDRIVANRLELIRQRKGMPAKPVGAPPPAASQTRPAGYISPAEFEANIKKLGGR